VHRGLCPSGPTAWRDHPCNRLAGNLGLEIEALFAGKRDGDFAEKQARYFRRVREAIDAGLPVIGWEMDEPEYYVVHGYVEDGNYLFRDFDGGVGRIHHTKVGDTAIGLHYLMIVRPGEPADDRTIVRGALGFALEVAEGRHGHGGEYATGLAGYDRWIAAFEEPETLLTDDVAPFGLAYNAACWAECRRYAVDFLKEARERLEDGDLNDQFESAVGHYQIVSASLGKVSELSPFVPSAGPQMQERLRDAERRSEALEALRAARNAEADGIETLRRIARRLQAGSA